MKRPADMAQNEKVDNCKLDKESVLYISFNKYQGELDSRNDRYERLVKLSRDITIQSKRVIFSLLRKEENSDNLTKDGETKVEAIIELIGKISEELKNEDPYKFARAISPGIQEFVEAVTLLFYIKNGELISYDDVRKLYFCHGENEVLFSHYDYMLGVADLTGELMRMAINCIGSRQFIRAENICKILRSIYQEYTIFAYENRDLSKKVSVMRASLNKVEKAFYNVQVRGSEVPDHMLQDIILGDDSDLRSNHTN